jgi:hypothetical protein
MLAAGGVHGGGPAEPQVISELTKDTLGMTSANSSANSQLPPVAKSHFTVVLPVARTLKRRLNMSPFKVTGVKLNQAALNWRRVVLLKGGLELRLENNPQLLRNPEEIAELRPVTVPMHWSFVES